VLILSYLFYISFSMGGVVNESIGPHCDRSQMNGGGYLASLYYESEACDVIKSIAREDV
jgi:hypothetical protein